MSNQLCYLHHPLEYKEPLMLLYTTQSSEMKYKILLLFSSGTSLNKCGKEDKHWSSKMKYYYVSCFYQTAGHLKQIKERIERVYSSTEWSHFGCPFNSSLRRFLSLLPCNFSSLGCLLSNSSCLGCLLSNSNCLGCLLWNFSISFLL